MSSYYLKKSFLKKNSIEFLVFFILVFSSWAFIIFQYSLTNENPRNLIKGDEPHYLALTSTILKHGSFNLEDHFFDPDPDPKLEWGPARGEGTIKKLCQHSWHGTIGSDGHCYPAHGIGTSILVLPAYQVGGILATMFEMSLIFGMLGVVIYKFCNRLTSSKSAFLSTLLICFGTILFSFSSEILSEIAVALILISVLYLFFYKPHNFQYLSIIGTLLGILIFFKATYAIFLVALLPIYGYLIFKDKSQRKNLKFLLGFCITIIILFWFYNFITGPEGNLGTNALIRKVLEGQKGIFENGLENFSNGLVSYLFGRHYGLFIFSPLALFSIFGFRFFWSQNRIITITFVLVISCWIIIHSWGHPGAGGFSLPSRYLIPIIPLLAVPLALLIEKFLKKPVFLALLIPLTLIGISFNIMFSSFRLQHGSPQFKAEIAENIYLGLVELLPTIPQKSGNIFLFEPPNPIFWVLVFGIVILFVILFFHPFFKKY